MMPIAGLRGGGRTNFELNKGSGGGEAFFTSIACVQEPRRIAPDIETIICWLFLFGELHTNPLISWQVDIYLCAFQQNLLLNLCERVMALHCHK